MPTKKKLLIIIIIIIILQQYKMHIKEVSFLSVLLKR